MEKNEVKIKSGYKQTPIGYIPDDWAMNNLIELAESGISNGIFTDPKKVGTGYWLINVINLYTEPNIITEYLERVDITEKEFLNKKVKNSDIFFTRSSLKLDGIAHCNINESNKDNMTFDGHIMKLSPCADRVNPKFLRFFCLARPARIFFMRRAKTTTMTTIGQAEIGSLPVPIPPLPEQEKIAVILSIWDSAIETTNKLIDAKKKLKKGFMQQLLTGKTRFVTFKRGIKRVKTKIGFLPEDWKICRVKEVFNRIQDRIVPKLDDVYQEIGIRSHGKGLFYKNKVHGRELGNKRVFKIIPNCFIVNIVFAWELAIGKTTKKENHMIASHRFPMYKPKEDSLDLDFIHLFFGTKRGKKLFELASPGGAGRNRTLGQKDFMNTFVPVPSIKEQQKIARALNIIEKEADTLNKKLNALKQQKKGLMQQLLTGKKRVKV